MSSITLRSWRERPFQKVSTARDHYETSSSLNGRQVNRELNKLHKQVNTHAGAIIFLGVIILCLLLKVHFG